MLPDAAAAAAAAAASDVASTSHHTLHAGKRVRFTADMERDKVVRPRHSAEAARARRINARQ